MLHVLSSYISNIKTLSTIEECSAFAGKVRSPLDKLYTDMSTCAKSKTGKTHHKVRSQLTKHIRAKLKKRMISYYPMTERMVFQIVPHMKVIGFWLARFKSQLHQECEHEVNTHKLLIILQHPSILKDPGVTTPVPNWQKGLLCRYVLDRLFSFSILTARVFAVGDPAGHSVTLNQICV